jgi:hypothetical protein
VKSARLVLVATLVACGSARPLPSMPTSSHVSSEPVGPLTRETLIAAQPAFAPSASIVLDDAAVAELQQSSELEVDVYLGAWCGDSRREVARFFALADRLPERLLQYRLVGVDRAKDAPGLDRSLDYVPTFVVRRRGVELGVIVEVPPVDLEHALASLASGRATGRLSATR